jgi:hypothetical protein
MAHKPVRIAIQKFWYLGIQIFLGFIRNVFQISGDNNMNC